jgi:hypothetical protein
LSATVVSSGWGLEDIEDVRRYVAQVVRRRWAQLGPSEMEEAVQEGIAIVYRLHAEWRPADCASFANLCSTYLPLRLTDWWRRDMRQRLICRRNGRSGAYHHSPVSSLNAMSERGFELAAAGDGRLGE